MSITQDLLDSTIVSDKSKKYHRGSFRVTQRPQAIRIETLLKNGEQKRTEPVVDEEEAAGAVVDDSKSRQKNIYRMSKIDPIDNAFAGNTSSRYGSTFNFGVVSGMMMSPGVMSATVKHQNNKKPETDP